jgi:putative transposase
MKVNRVERHIINKNHPCYKSFDELCYKSKNIYNYANYTIRQEFIINGKYIKYTDLSKLLNHSESFIDLGSNSSQMTLRILDKTWKSFFVAIKDWTKYPNKYLGRPKIPKYKKKDGRFTCVLTNMQTHIKDGYLYFAFKELKIFNNLFITKIKGKLLQTRIIPQGDNYILEIVYEKEVPNTVNRNDKILGIDLGLDNFVTMVDNIGSLPIVINGKNIKSYNQFWNKQMSHYKSLAKKVNKLNWTKRLSNLTTKRNNKINYFIHKASKEVINYCLFNNIDTVVIGNNKQWKQNCNLGKTTQGFVQIPHTEFINKLKYKCEDYGINFIVTEESYTSKASFLDNDTMPKYGDKFDFKFSGERIYRGLYRSKNNELINADCNGAYNIMKKVFPNVFTNGIEGVHLHPIIINI